MEKQLNQLAKIKALRQFLLRQVESLSPAQLNRIPQGYTNNIIWHLAHLNSTLQALCYGLSGLPPALAERWFRAYLPGTHPEGPLSEADIAEVKALLLSSPDKLRADYEQGIFRQFTPSKRLLELYGVAVNDLGDALDFVLYHEGFHIGYVVAIRHLV